MARKLIFLFLMHVWLEGSLAQHSPFSLQAAVDALHRREAQLALKDNYNGPMRYGIPPATAQEQDYWDDDTEGGPASLTPTQQHSNNRHKLNRILAKYLAREEDNVRNSGGLGASGGSGGYEFDEDNNYLPDEKKRSSFFRERDDPSTTALRDPNNLPYDRSELTDQFLKEIEEARELDREERYKEALRRIWERYQQQENELEGDLFEDQKRMIPQPNYYVGPLMQKKRTYPVLPWLPMSRRKRFPVAKRSPKMPFDESSKISVERVPDELRELFGKPNEDKKKRSTDGQSTDATTEKKNETSTSTATVEPQTEHPPHGGHHHKEHKHRKRSDHAHESQEEEEEDSEEHEPEHEEHEEHEEEDEEEHDDFEDEDEAQKKKREVSGKRSNLEVVKEDQILPGDLSNFRGKKSIQWSKYFGIDRRKKSGYENENSKKLEPTDEEETDEDKRKKKDIDPERLDNMGKKLQTIEDLIIAETVKYTGAHEGIGDPEEIARLKDHVVSRLATAYSLEKMRRALEKLRQSVDNENHLLRNVVESEPKSEDDESDIENQKRLSVKKEKVEFQGLHHSINTPNNEKSKDLQGNSMTADTNEEDEDKKKKKQKKRTGYQRYPEVPNEVSEFEEELGAGHYEPLNDAYLGNKNYIPGTSNQCPLVDSMAQRCRGVDLLSGDINQELLPLCGIHQICYLCGTSQVSCDFQYLAEVDSICGRNNECQSAARSILMILRGSPGPQIGPKECLKSPCLNRAMREIGL